MAQMFQVQDRISQTLENWGRVDVLINIAGILRDASFGKAAIDEFRKVVDVHLTGVVVCSRAVWGTMRETGCGQILMTSNSGLYGNFGQANYGVALTGDQLSAEGVADRFQLIFESGQRGHTPMDRRSS